MEKEFVQYQESFELKQLGLDEPCFGYYEPNGDFNYIESNILKNFPYLAKNSEWKDLCGAPTYSQCFRWFRQNGYRFDIVNDSENINGYYYYDVWHNGQFMFESHYIYPTYEDAELACLRKLIEILKNK